jgi:hypothetical protein
MGMPMYKGIYIRAAYGGHLAMLRCFRATDALPWEANICIAASKGGRVEVLQWLRAQHPPCPWNEDTCAYAADSGHLEMLQWLRAQDPPCPWDINGCLEAAAGKVEVQQWLQTHPDFVPEDFVPAEDADRTSSDEEG